MKNINFKENFYTDIRYENVKESKIVYLDGELQEMKEKQEKGAFIRVYDGTRWYYSSTTNLSRIQDEVNKLYSMGKEYKKINEDENIKKLQVNKAEYLKYNDALGKIPMEEKHNLLKEYLKVLKEAKYLKSFKVVYIDNRIVKRIVSSKGTDVTFDKESCGISMRFTFSKGEKTFKDGFDLGKDSFESLKDGKEKLRKFLNKCEDFLINSKNVEQGKYTVILSPQAAGVFAHESFGHKSEADFMVGDETMIKEWSIGKQVGSPILSIVDSGEIVGSGYVPFDDEGTKAGENYLIKNGKLFGRLHSSKTAVSLKEELTGNARALNFEYEPMVRMTNTYILPGKSTLEELISEVKDGFLIDTIKHGSGMSTFTIAPSISYRIKDGKIVEPVKISVISGTVFETLKNVDGLSKELQMLSFVTGGCGKMDQFPLPVGFGGPYVKVLNMNVQ
ncbi:TldD/PmbA family protein [Haloimpatiens sp. FM7330]|uniref:TldD/PmbA family protein n=1 Tax=Haloimpatiens sp. FM7330 TaxID=3298610 RepID=UPI00363A56EF